MVTSDFTVSPASTCFKFDFNSASITFDIACVNAVANTALDVNFKLSINLTDSNPTKPLSKVYSLTFTVP